MKSSKIALAASLALALAFTLSCTDGGGNDPDGSSGGSSAGKLVTSNNIKDVTGSSFTVLEKEYECENGVLKEVIDDQNSHYEISEGKLTIDGSLVLNGSSSVLKGTWTKDKEKGFGDEYWITKMVFTDNNVTTTYEVCMEDIESVIFEGFKMIGTVSVIDCYNAKLEILGKEIMSGLELGREKMDISFIYGSKKCPLKMNPSVSEMERACAIDDEYDAVLEGEWQDCMKEIFIEAGLPVNSSLKLLSKPAMLFRK